MITANYWTKSEHVTAVRLDENNIRDVATAIGGELWEEGNGWAPRGRKKPLPHIYISPNTKAGIGDWVTMQGDTVKFYSDERFLSKFHTLPEMMSENDKLARIHKIIMDSMHSARWGNENESFETIAALAALQVMDL